VSAALDGQRQQTNRNMARMGVNPNSGRFAAMQGVMDLGAATAKASAANVGRTQAVDKAYARSGDVLNTYSGMASSAPTFYNAGTNSGNSAVNNQMIPGTAMMTGISQSNATQMSGQRMALGGLSNVLSAQGSAYGTATTAATARRAQNMDLIGTGVGLAFSDRRLKENIVKVGVDETTGLNLYEFSYLNSDGKRYVGVMADEVESRFPSAVEHDDCGFASENYGLLGNEFKEVA